MTQQTVTLRLDLQPELADHIKKSAALVGLSVADYIDHIYRAWVIRAGEAAKVDAILESVTLLVARGTEERFANEEARRAIASLSN